MIQNQPETQICTMSMNFCSKIHESQNTCRRNMSRNKFIIYEQAQFHSSRQYEQNWFHPWDNMNKIIANGGIISFPFSKGIGKRNEGQNFNWMSIRTKELMYLCFHTKPLLYITMYEDPVSLAGLAHSEQLLVCDCHNLLGIAFCGITNLWFA